MVREKKPLKVHTLHSAFFPATVHISVKLVFFFRCQYCCYGNKGNFMFKTSAKNARQTTFVVSHQCSLAPKTCHLNFPRIMLPTSHAPLLHAIFQHTTHLVQFSGKRILHLRNATVNHSLSPTYKLGKWVIKKNNEHSCWPPLMCQFCKTKWE